MSKVIELGLSFGSQFQVESSHHYTADSLHMLNLLSSQEALIASMFYFRAPPKCMYMYAPSPTFRVFFVFNFRQFDYGTSGHEFFWIYSFWDVFSSLNL